MASIDQRIVEMRFNRDDFNKGVAETLDGIQKLDDTLAGAGGIADNVSKVSSKFNALGALGFTALQRLGNAAMDTGSKMISQVMDPIFEGGKKRALNIEQARFQFEGLGMDVEAAMASANEAVLGTAFGLDEAAVVAAQFGASGMRAGEDMTNALRGISGVAAMAGSSYGDIGNIFTKVAGQGRLMGDDLLRLSARGINAAATLADYFRNVRGESDMTESKIREMVTKGEIDFQLFADAMSNAFGEHATKANDTYTGSLSNMRAALARIGAEFASVKHEKHRRMFNALTPVINEVKGAMEPLFEVYQEFANLAAKKFEARALMVLENVDWESLKSIIGDISYGFLNLKKAIDSFIAPITAAFKAVFNTGEAGEVLLSVISGLTGVFEKWTSSLILTEGQQNKLQAAMEKFFRAIKMGLTPIGWIKYALDNLHKAFEVVGNFVLRVVPSWGAELIKFGIVAQGLGGGVSGVFKALIIKLKEFGSSIRDFYESFKSGESSMDSFANKTTAAVDRVKSALQWLYNTGRAIVQGFSDVWNLLGDAINGTMDSLSENAGAMEKILNAISPILKGLRDAVSGLFEGIGKVFKEEDPLVLFMGLQTLLGNIMGLMLAGGLRDLFSGIGDGFKAAGESIGGFFDRINPKVEQTKPTRIFLIAASLAALAGAMVLISRVPQDRMLDVAVALGATAGILTIVMKALANITTGRELKALPAMVVSLAIFSGALVLMAVALEKIGSVPADNLWSAVGAITAMSIVLTVMADRLSSIQPGNVIAAAFSIGIIAGAMMILSLSIAALGALPTETIIQGGIAVIAMLAALTGAAILLDQFAGNVVLSAIGLMAMAAALNMMVVPITALGLLPFQVLDQGMRNLALVLGGLVVAAIALNFLAPNMVLSAVGLMAMALALNMMVVPILALGFLPYESLQQGLIAVGVALLALVVAASLMQGAAVGSLAMIAIAAAMVILSVAIAMLAALPYEAAMNGMILMAVGLGIMVAAALAAQFVLPGLLGLAAIVAAFGFAALAMGAALIMAAVGVSIFAATLPLLTSGLVGFAEQSMRIAVGIPILAALGLAMIPLAAAAIALGAGMMLLGVGIALLSGGLMLLSVTGPAGTRALMAFFSALNEMGLKQMAKLALLTVEFAAMGAALLVLGAGLVLTGAGALVAAVGLGLLAGAGLLASTVGTRLKTAFSGMEPVIANIEGLGRAFMSLGSSLGSITGAMTGLLVSFSSVGAMLSVITVGILMLATVSGSVSGVVTASFMTMASGMAVSAVLIQATANQIVGSIRGLASGVAGVAPIAGAAVSLMISMMVSSLSNGRGRIVASIALIVAAFTVLASQLASVGRPSAAEVRRMIVNIVRELGRGVTLIPKAIAVLVRAMGRLSTGINQNGTKASTAARNMVSRVTAAIASGGATAYSRAYVVGVSISNGMARGIRAGGGSVAAAARSIAISSMNSAKAALGVASPSKEFYKIAEFVVDGFVGGLENGESVVSRASEDLGEESLNSIRDTINEIFEEFDDLSLLDLSPTITPVLDLDAIRGQATGIGQALGSQTLDASFSRNQASSIAVLEDAIRSAVETASQGEGRGDTFIQNNYSPESLSAATIYRQTRNQLSSAKNRKRRE